LNKKLAKRFGGFKKSPYLCKVKTIKTITIWQLN